MWMIMSDSHDNVPKVSRAIDLAIERGVSVVFHCGDLVSPFTARELLRYKGTLHVVFGNNDGERIGLKIFWDLRSEPALFLCRSKAEKW